MGRRHWLGAFAFWRNRDPEAVELTRQPHALAIVPVVALHGS
jgi:hypothetical protein